MRQPFRFFKSTGFLLLFAILMSLVPAIRTYGQEDKDQNPEQEIIQLKILFSSRRSVEMIGIDSKDVDPSAFLKLMHPDDLLWKSIFWEKMLNLGHQIFNEKKGNTIISSNFRLKNPSGEYTNTLVQCYLFFTDVPYKTVFILHVLTDISWFKKVSPGYHYFFGNDPSYFRYPNEKMLTAGNIFSAM